METSGRKFKERSESARAYPRCIDAQREKLIELRDSGAINDDVLRSSR